MLPVWLSMLGWNLAYATAATTMVQQAGSMDTTVGAGDFPVSPAAMFVCVTVTLLVLVPTYERAVLPALRRNQERIEREEEEEMAAMTTGGDKINGSSRPRRRRFSSFSSFFSSLVPPTLLQRAGCACLTIAAAQFLAAGVERARLQTLTGGRSPQQQQQQPSTTAAASSLSIAWLVPQYCLVGVSEFFYVAAIEFFYEQAPPRLRSLASALPSPAAAPAKISKEKRATGAGTRAR